jgi:hypothetical protein
MGLTRTVALLAMFLSPFAYAKKGTVGWGEAQVVGEIDSRELPEASGIAVSQADSSRLYHINDAGSSPTIVVTDRQGRYPSTIDLDVVSVTDTEDLALGVCPDEGHCLYIGDIGDNKAKRPHVILHVVRDQASLPSRLVPAFSARLVYDDGLAHNAESLAIHPSGYAYILTKEIPAVFFRFPVAALKDQEEITLEKVGSIDLTEWLAGTDKPNKIIPTSMDIRPDGRQLVILTRAAGISVDIDLEQSLKRGRSDVNSIVARYGLPVSKLPMIKLPQTEAITYDGDGSAIIYSSEIVETGGTSAPLVRIERQR